MWRCMADRSLPSRLGLVGVMRVVALGLILGELSLPWLGLQQGVPHTSDAQQAAKHAAQLAWERAASSSCTRAMQQRTAGQLACHAEQATARCRSGGWAPRPFEPLLQRACSRAHRLWWWWRPWGVLPTRTSVACAVALPSGLGKGLVWSRLPVTPLLWCGCAGAPVISPICMGCSRVQREEHRRA